MKADTAIKKAVHELAVYDTELQKDVQKASRAETKLVGFGTVVDDQINGKKH